MNSLKKINRILFITLIVFSACVFGSYSKTSSKYVIDKNDNIINKTNFKILTRDVPVSSKFVGEKAVFDFNFYRTAAKDDSKVKSDTIELNFENASLNKCKIKTDGITGFQTNSSKNSYTITSKGVKFVYGDVTSNTTVDKSVKVTYECDIDDSILTSDDYVQTNFIVTEKIKLKDNTEEETFELFRKTAKTSEKYVKPDPEDPVYLDNYKKIKFIDKTMNRTFLIEWIDKYVLEYYSSEIQDASLPNFNNTLVSYLNYNTTNWNPNSIKGISYDATNKIYTFDDNIISYANTSISSSSPKNLYFKKPAGREYTKEEIDKIFKEYYDEYYSESPATSEDKEIYDYIVNKGGVSSIILENNSIFGVNYNSKFNVVTIDKKMINLKLHPINPDIILEGVKDNFPDARSILQIVASGISDFVNKNLGISDFDENLITRNSFLSDYIVDLKNTAKPNSYYYLSLGTKVLSMHIYNDGSDYIMHLDYFDTYDMEKKVDKHVLSSLDTKYKQTTDTNDYSQLRADFTAYIKGLDATYGTTFETDGAINQLNTTINKIIQEVSNGATKVDTIEDIFTETTKNLKIAIRYNATSRVTYGKFEIEFVPPIEQTTTANSASKVPIKTTSSTSTKITTNTSTLSSATTTTVPTTLTTTVKTTSKVYTDVSLNDNKVGSNN